nr:Hemin transport protein HemS [Paraburkholderia busanensis]
MDLLHSIKENNGRVYAYDLGKEHGVTEGELAVARLGHDAKVMDIADIKAFIAELETLGELKAVTRNEFAVSTQIGAYTNQHLYGFRKMDVSARAGLILNPRDVDLRIFFSYWKHVFYIADKKRGRSIHVFDHNGTATHKIYETKNTNTRAFDALLKKYVSDEGESITFDAPTPQDSGMPEPEFNAEADSAWRGMKDPHDFYMLMHRFRMDRLGLMKSVRGDLAFRVANDAVEKVLAGSKAQNLDISLFVSNPGTVQIFTGVPDLIFRQGDWLNVHSKNFYFHLQDQKIASCWVVKKPCDCDYVTSVEAFAEDGTQIVQIFGQRDEGTFERAEWRQIVETVSA